MDAVRKSTINNVNFNRYSKLSQNMYIICYTIHCIFFSKRETITALCWLPPSFDDKNTHYKTLKDADLKSRSDSNVIALMVGYSTGVWRLFSMVSLSRQTHIMYSYILYNVIQYDIPQYMF